MRIALTLIAAGLAMAGSPKQELVTYVDGNVTGVAPNTGGSLVFANDSGMELRTGLATSAIPYAKISKAQLGRIREQASTEPLYKVWTLHKKIMKPQLQKLALEYKNVDGEDKSMTIELERGAAAETIKTILSYNEGVDTGIRQEASKTQEWWGDSVWKTSRNKDVWAPVTAPAAAK
jgi:hypothetical protein